MLFNSTQGDSFILNADLDSTQGDEQQVGLDYPTTCTRSHTREYSVT